MSTSFPSPAPSFNGFWSQDLPILIRPAARRLAAGRCTRACAVRLPAPSGQVGSLTIDLGHDRRGASWQSCHADPSGRRPRGVQRSAYRCRASGPRSAKALPGARPASGAVGQFHDGHQPFRNGSHNSGATVTVKIFRHGQLTFAGPETAAAHFFEQYNVKTTDVGLLLPLPPVRISFTASGRGRLRHRTHRVHLLDLSGCSTTLKSKPLTLEITPDARGVETMRW